MAGLSTGNTMNSETAAISELVHCLSSRSAESVTRDQAAREIYRRGCALAEQAIAGWRENAEIAAFISGRATVGVAVTPEHFAAIRSALGNPRLANVPPDQDAEEFEWSLGADVRLDILTTRQPGGTGAIARFLAKFGEGIQQVELPTPDADWAAAMIRSRLGIAPIYPTARAGADGTRVNFFLASTEDGKKVLIELIESRKEA